MYLDKKSVLINYMSVNISVTVLKNATGICVCSWHFLFFNFHVSKCKSLSKKIYTVDNVGQKYTKFFGYFVVSSVINSTVL